MQNPYEILGVSTNASLDEVKSAYKKLAKKYHPDVNKEPDAEDNFKKINEAYEEIINPKPKNTGFSQPQNPFHNNPFDIFNFDFFGRANKNLNTPISLKLNLNINEVYNDVKKTINYQRIVCCDECLGKCGFGNVSTCTVCLGSGNIKKTFQQGPMFIEQNLGPCQNCSGKGRIYENRCQKCQGNGIIEKIESFNLELSKGTLFKARVFENLGNQQDPSSNPGHLIIEIGLEESDLYKYDSNFNLMLFKTIDPILAILGEEITIDLPNNEKIHTKLINNTNNEHVISFQNKGLPKSQNEYGTLLVKILYNIPDNISSEEKNILKSYLNSRKQRGLL